MKVVSTVVFLVVSCCSVIAQVGRHEMPIDTLPIGGREQQRETVQMEGQDELITVIRSLSDSVSIYLNSEEESRSSGAIDSVRVLHRELLETLRSLEQSEINSVKMREGYREVDELRGALRRLRLAGSR